MTNDSKYEWLERAQAMQIIEGNPLTDEEYARFVAWIDAGLTTEEMRQQVMKRWVS